MFLKKTDTWEKLTRKTKRCGTEGVLSSVASCHRKAFATLDIRYTCGQRDARQIELEPMAADAKYCAFNLLLCDPLRILSNSAPNKLSSESWEKLAASPNGFQSPISSDSDRVAPELLVVLDNSFCKHTSINPRPNCSINSVFVRPALRKLQCIVFKKFNRQR